MFLEISTAEEFLGLLEAENDKEIPIFLGQITQYDQRGMGSVSLVVQYQYDHSMIVQYKENVGSGWLPRDTGDAQGTASAQAMDKTLEEKKNVVVAMLNQKGFTNIVSSIWV